MLSYLESLTLRLARAAAELPEPFRRRHGQYVARLQLDDGGFPGRVPEAGDLYYTGFALRTLAIVGLLEGQLARRAADFLRRRSQGRESIVDLFSLIYGAQLVESAAGIPVLEPPADAGSNPAPHDWRQAVAQLLERLRRDDGGYAKAPEGVASSTYHTFLVLLCLQLIDRPVPQPQRVVEFLWAQRGEDGGFREIRASKRSGTNPTAAAIGALQILDQLEEPIRLEAAEFLGDMQTDEGGWRANTRIPIADLLSTFTGLWTLEQLGAADSIDRTAALQYTQSLEVESGGFLGAVWDQSPDVEYTFYGVATTALLA